MIACYKWDEMPLLLSILLSDNISISKVSIFQTTQTCQNTSWKFGKKSSLKYFVQITYNDRDARAATTLSYIIIITRVSLTPSIHTCHKTSWKFGEKIFWPNKFWWQRCQGCLYTISHCQYLQGVSNSIHPHLPQVFLKILRKILLEIFWPNKFCWQRCHGCHCTVWYCQYL